MVHTNFLEFTWADGSQRGEAFLLTVGASSLTAEVLRLQSVKVVIRHSIAFLGPKLPPSHLVLFGPSRTFVADWVGHCVENQGEIIFGSLHKIDAMRSWPLQKIILGELFM